MPRPSEPARALLIETAERLFAERGIEAVSLRDVSKEAGQRNHSAAQYHFGDRAGLVAAVFTNRMAIVNERRHALLDEIDGDDLREIVRAAVEPLAGVVIEADGWYGRFLVRARWDSFAQEVVAELPVMSSWTRLVGVLVPHLRGLRLPLRRARLEQMGTLLIGSVAGWEWQRERGELRVAARAMQADLVATITAVLTAPADIRQGVA
jgi:AcrR family transcriptional regulator